VLNGLLDALLIPSFWTNAEREEMRTLIVETLVRWCGDLWRAGFGGGFFWYSPEKADAVFGINASAMFLGSMVRFLDEHGDAMKADERRLVWDRADQLAQAMVATVALREGAPYWDYVPAPNVFSHQWPNDLIHHVYTLWGIELYRDCGGHVRLPWTRGQAVESVDRFWRDGRICRFAQDVVYSEAVYSKTDADLRNMPPRLWSPGMMLAFYGKWGDEARASRAFDAICRVYGPWPKLRLYPRDSCEADDDSFYPRYAAHVLYGLALHCFGSGS
jgi:hypothetical protein